MSRNEDGDEREPGDFDDALMEREAREVYEELLARVGESAPQPRLEATRRAAELLGDPQRAYPVIHITGTNGKTSTSRMIESILRAHGLRTGMLTSPHLERVNERIVIDGEPISNAAFVSNWQDVRPFLDITDAELELTDQEPLSFFEALTLLAFAAFADAPVDVVVLEVGMGGEWDSTNVADGQVAVFTPIALDHQARLGNTIAAIARTKSGIIKPAAAVVSAAQVPEALAELRRAAELTESTFAVAGSDFELVTDTVAVGGQVITVKGLAATYSDLFLPLFGDHQAGNAVLAIAAVESFIGGGSLPLNQDVLAEGLATATLARPTAGHRKRADRGRGCRPQPAWCGGARGGAHGILHVRPCHRGARHPGRQGRRGHPARARGSRGRLRHHAVDIRSGGVGTGAGQTRNLDSW